MSLFDQWIGSSDDVIKNAAQMVDDATTQYKAKQISLQEYRELCNDVLDYQSISANIADMARKQTIWDAFQAILNIVETVASI